MNYRTKALAVAAFSLTVAGFGGHAAAATGPRPQPLAACDAPSSIETKYGLGSIERIEAVGQRAVSGAASETNVVGETEELRLSGWAGAPNHRAANAVCLITDGRVRSDAVVEIGILRRDVAKVQGAFLSNSGFVITIKAKSLGRGAHIVSVGIKDASDRIRLLQRTEVIVR